MTVRHIRSRLLASAFLLIALLLSVRAQAQDAGMNANGTMTAGIMVGLFAPDAVVQTLDGQAIRLSELIRGQPAVLEFWATWCPLCKQLEPAMKAAREKHGEDVVFVSVGVKDNQTAAMQRAYVREHMLGGRFVFDKDGEAVRTFKAPQTSYVVVLDAIGRVVYTGVGGDQDIEAALKHLRMGMGMDGWD